MKNVAKFTIALVGFVVISLLRGTATFAKSVGLLGQKNATTQIAKQSGDTPWGRVSTVSSVARNVGDTPWGKVGSVSKTAKNVGDTPWGKTGVQR